MTATTPRPSTARESSAQDADLDERLLGVVERSQQDGSVLPGEPTLASMLGVSRPTLREALARLERSGVIHRRQGSRPIVNRDALDLAGRFDQNSDFLDVLAAAGHVGSMEVLREDRITLSRDAAATLGVEPGSPGLRVVKRWLADARPVRLVIDEISLPDPAAANPVSKSVLDMVPELTGEAVLWELAIPTAVNATRELAEWLGVPLRSALLKLDCTGISQSGRHAFRAEDYHVPGAIRLGLMRTVSTD